LPVPPRRDAASAVLGRFPRTKIHATLGPASRSPEVLAGLISAGITACRVNLSHASAEELPVVAQAVRREAARQGRTVAVFGDLRGRKLRLGSLAGGKVVLQAGQRYRLAPGEETGDASGAAVDCPDLAGAVEPGTPVLLDDGALRLRVEKIEGGALLCRVEVGGELPERSGVNFPGVRLNLPPLTAKDLGDLDLAVAAEVDFLYFSYVQGPGDILALRRELAARGAAIPIVAKVEQVEAVRHVEEIVAKVDGICLARGDLGVEVPWGDLPRVQEQAVAAARAAGKMVVLGGEVLQSLTHHSRPYRAETTDVAVAVQQGVDAIVLSDETAVGMDPVGAVQILAEMLLANEAALGWPPASDVSPLRAESAAEAQAWSLRRPRRSILLDLPLDETCQAPWLVNWWGVFAG